MKRSTIVFIVLAALGIFALACAPVAAPAPAATTAPAAATTAPVQATSAPAEATTAPATTGAAGEVFFGAIHPLTGGLAQDGSFLQNGIDLAVSEINDAGGIGCLDGAKLRVEHADSQGKPEVGQSE